MAHLARQLVAGAIEDFEAPLRSGQIVSNDSISGILTTHYYANNPRTEDSGQRSRPEG